MANNIIIGIDPDNKASGCCVMNQDNTFTYCALPFVDLMYYLEDLSMQPEINVTVIVEASWLVKRSNFHGGGGRVAEHIARSVGMNHMVGMLIVELCRTYGLNVIEQKPLKHKWKKGKISADEFNELTGHKGRSNQDMRDAALLALHYAGKL